MTTGITREGCRITARVAIGQLQLGLMRAIPASLIAMPSIELP
jgi:hypothetical protein